MNEKSNKVFAYAPYKTNFFHNKKLMKSTMTTQLELAKKIGVGVNP